MLWWKLVRTTYWLLLIVEQHHEFFSSQFVRSWYISRANRKGHQELRQHRSEEDRTVTQAMDICIWSGSITKTCSPKSPLPLPKTTQQNQPSKTTPSSCSPTLQQKLELYQVEKCTHDSWMFSCNGLVQLKARLGNGMPAFSKLWPLLHLTSFLCYSALDHWSAPKVLGRFIIVLGWSSRSTILLGFFLMKRTMVRGSRTIIQC